MGKINFTILPETTHHFEYGGYVYYNGTHEIDFIEGEKFNPTPGFGLHIHFNSIDDDVKPVDMSHMFERISKVTGLEHWNTSEATNMSSIFKNAGIVEGYGSWDTSKVKDLSRAFYNDAYRFPSTNNVAKYCGSWDVSSCTNFAYFLHYQVGDQPLDLSGWVLNKKEEVNLNHAFSEIYFDVIGISNWDVCKVNNVTSLIKNSLNFFSDLSNWKLPLVGSMPSSFAEGSYLAAHTHLHPQWGAPCTIPIEDTDLLFATDTGDSITKKVTGAQFKEFFK